MTIAPLYYPPANRTTQRFDDNHPGSHYPAVEKVVWHSTETGGWPGYSGGSIAPHMTGLPDLKAKKIRWRAHYPANMNSRALRNTPGGVQTNLDGAFQIELIGTCDPAAHRSYPDRIYMPAAPDWYLQELAEFAAWAHEHWSVPLHAPAFQAYPGSAGARKPSGPSNTVRMTGKTWDAFRGHCGHQHVPENVHGDPGSLHLPTVLDKANDLLKGADDMELKDTVTLSAAAAKAMTAATATPRKEGDTLSVSYLLQWGGPGAYRILSEVRAVKAQNTALTAAVSALAASVRATSPEGVSAAFAAGVDAIKAELANLDVHIVVDDAPAS